MEEEDFLKISRKFIHVILIRKKNFLLVNLIKLLIKLDFLESERKKLFQNVSYG